MSFQVTGSFQLMKSMNRSLILNTIRTNGAISRADIAKITKLTPPTVTNIVNELLKENLVVESKTGISSGGRKPILLSINSSSRYIIGLDVGVKKIRYALSDLNANLLVSKVKRMPPQLTVESFLQVLVQVIQDSIDGMEENKDKLLGIGIAMHGIVDSETGTSLFAPSLKLEGIKVKEHLEQLFEIPVRMENDAKALALGEQWFGNGQGIRDLICINVGEGIGAGLIVNNRIFHGSNSIAGEIGHTMIDMNGPLCTCGSVGCFQTLASGQALRERAMKEISLGKETTLIEKVNSEISNIDGHIIYECAKKGDTLSQQVLKDTGHYIGIGIINIIHFFNPSLIIIGGGVSKAKEFILEPINNVINDRAITHDSKKTPIIFSALGDNGSLIGAITLVLTEIYTT
ncbi:ROK family transcriptional regulator [Evansella sp. AB-rgal1]|uniref:ROK family transcriptional regulator n=1 Tax=Evansella sp. AB-rgal1 TaxID=3242696 RepID=UPI00359ED77B